MVFREDEPFEWYQSFSGIAHLMNPYLQSAQKVLVAGCGNSKLSEELQTQNQTEMVANIDISGVVIKSMIKKYKDTRELTWEVMDVMKMSFPAGAFNAIVDKGTLDTLLCSDDAETNAEACLMEYSRVLQPGGVALILSYGNYESRKQYLEVPAYGWELQAVKTVGKPSVRLELAEEKSSGEDVHFLYVLVKK
mmetsp:Transcript_28044/g.55173  ORF Transcript_28044/g.55173 Transcript_28044/m.55173 type:complete len:193 (+) Transcript_28044:41-619(+)